MAYQHDLGLRSTPTSHPHHYVPLPRTSSGEHRHSGIARCRYPVVYRRNVRSYQPHILSQGRLVPGMVSFKLDDYSPENSELKGIKVLVNPVDGEEKTYIFSYPLTGEDVPGFNPLDLAELK